MLNTVLVNSEIARRKPSVVGSTLAERTIGEFAEHGLEAANAAVGLKMMLIRSKAGKLPGFDAAQADRNIADLQLVQTICNRLHTDRAPSN